MSLIKEKYIETDVKDVRDKDYLKIVAGNSFWNVVSYFVSGLAALIGSIVITRSLGPTQYGVYSFFISFIAVGCLLLDFGIGQATAKYVPRYFNDESNKGLAVKIFLWFLLIQAVASVLIAFLLIAFFPHWKFLIKVNNPSVGILVYISILALVPATLGRQLNNFLSAIQKNRKIAITNIIIQTINLFLMVLIVYLNKGLILLLSLQILTNILICLIQIKYLIPLLIYNKSPKKRVVFADIRNYTVLAYINVIVSFIVWSYSEIFFLSYFSSEKEIGFYSLAFSLSSMVSSIPGLCLQTIYNIQYELLERGEEDRSDRISSMNVKMMSMIFIPFSIYVAFFSKNIIYFLYGSEYQKVAYILPMVLFGTIMSTTLGSPIIKANNNNRVYGKTMVLSILGAFVNLALNYFLVPRYHSIGAGVANIISQLFLTILIVGYVFRVMKIRIEWNKIINIYIVNIVLATVLLAVNYFPMGVFPRVIVLLVTLYLYFVLLVKRKIFDEFDLSILIKIAVRSPRILNKLLINIHDLIAKEIIIKDV